MSPADGPTAVPAQPAANLNDEQRAALRAARARLGHAGPRAGDEHLALSAAVPVDGDSLATQLVRELVRSFHVGRARVASEVDGLADRGVDVALKRGLHADMRGDVDLVCRREPALDVGGGV